MPNTPKRGMRRGIKVEGGALWQSAPAAAKSSDRLVRLAALQDGAVLSVVVSPHDVPFLEWPDVMF
jgi:hypothetical protein